jgi:hypothetical protein
MCKFASVRTVHGVGQVEGALRNTIRVKNLTGVKNRAVGSQDALLLLSAQHSREIGAMRACVQKRIGRRVAPTARWVKVPISPIFGSGDDGPRTVSNRPKAVRRRALATAVGAAKTAFLGYLAARGLERGVATAEWE